ncbi:MAG: hypothetical protein AVDCRST_MAG50-1811 [uncultured Acidimicrobiales bacterium]|uniref:NERD domain-containing protein n=1 Tax=uncultured Acidimicrobiales bacterium TaxID=310071 RepID=A0A6J4I873_9ACTN|nr:MAG: hypothetical protein AVDCRST_MAG50-1811 [uncultured Acidimicrobiales bacterium]
MAVPVPVRHEGATPVNVGVTSRSVRGLGARQQARRDVREAVRQRFERLHDEGFVVLHDRQAGGLESIDHIVIGPKGVYVIDAQPSSGLLEIRSTRSFVRPTQRQVFVQGRAQDKRVDAMAGQISAVRDAAGDMVEACSGTFSAVLCFVGADLAVTQKPVLVGDGHVTVTWPGRFVQDVSRQGPLTPAMVQMVAGRIAASLRPAF